jgi:hypothetical protein
MPHDDDGLTNRSASGPTNTAPHQLSGMSLDEIGIVCGTDKSSLRQNYLIHYDRMLRDFREKPITLMEIGVYNGASLMMWERYFQNATIVGIDIIQSCVQFAGGRVKVEIGSQDDPEFLATVSAKYRPDVIIDDGSHRADHMIFTFERLFPVLQPGGCYVVEDIGAHGHPGGERHRGTSQVSAIDYFTELQRPVLTGWLDPGKLAGLPHYLSRTMARVEVAPSLVAMWKVSQSPAVDPDHLEKLTAESGKDEAWLFLSEFFQRHTGNLSRAHAASMRAVALMPRSPWAHLRLSLVQEARGDLEGALEAAKAAAELGPPNHALFRDRLQQLITRKPV